MVLFPPARQWAGHFSALIRVALSPRGLLPTTAFALTALAALAPSSEAQTVKEILKKVEDTYGKASAYQGSLLIKRSGKGQDGKPASVTQNQQIKYKSPNFVNMQVTVTGTGAAAALASRANSTVVSDGKNFYVYQPAQKQYMKRPAPATFPLRQLLSAVIPGSNTPNAKLLAPASVKGRPVFVVEIKPQMPPNLPAAQKEMFAKVKPALVMVDKQNFQVLQIKQSSPDGSLVIDFGPQNLKPALPGKLFAFTPPAGAKEFVPPANTQGAGGATTPGGSLLPPGTGGR
jgi:outer membrane lipoprotein-sorting protein